jgi:Glycoside hydrolase family 44/Putative Ig domain
VRRLGRTAIPGIVAGALLLSVTGSRAPADSTVMLAVNGAANQHAISPYIYGLNYADPALASAIGLPVDRWGGNTTDTYNWQRGSSNTGLDYYFENIADCFQVVSPCAPGSSYRAYEHFIAGDRTSGAKTLLTLPMMGYVAKDAPTNHPFTCGFPKTVDANQTSFDQYDHNCGNGMKPGNAFVTADPTRDGTAVDPVSDPSYYTGWLAKLTTLYGTAATGGVAFYELGNEPALWNSTHRDMHPNPETASELWSKSMHLATLVKAADPGAQVLGLSDWGWPAYFCTAKDNFGSGCDATGCSSGAECASHGNIAVAAWLLQQFKAYDTTTGVRHLDYLDLHYYAQGGSTPDVTRSLWDPTYTDPSWINDVIRLIPRMHDWVAQNYPGTKISLSEYNLSVTSDAATNAIIQADTLGIFGREGLDLATRWPLGNDGNLIGDAFRMYRNYDGNHSTFGDTSVQSTSSDQSRLVVYGARRSSDGAYTMMVLNKTSAAVSGHLALSGFSPPASADTWTWTGGGSGIKHAGSAAISGDAIDASFPAMSMTLYVIHPPASSSSCPTITVTPSKLPGPTIGSRYTQTFSASGGSAPYTFTATDSLPGGLTLSGGRLAGTPTAPTGRHTLTVQAQDAQGCRGMGSYTLSVLARPAIRLVTTKIMRSGAISVKVATLFAGRLTGSATTTAAGALPATDLTARVARRAKVVTYATGTLSIRHAGTVSLVLKPTKAGKRLLRRKHRLKLLITIRFAPHRGHAVTAAEHAVVNARVLRLG